MRRRACPSACSPSRSPARPVSRRRPAPAPAAASPTRRPRRDSRRWRPPRPRARAASGERLPAAAPPMIRCTAWRRPTWRTRTAGCRLPAPASIGSSAPIPSTTAAGVLIGILDTGIDPGDPRAAHDVRPAVPRSSTFATSRARARSPLARVTPAGDSVRRRQPLAWRVRAGRRAEHGRTVLRRHHRRDPAGRRRPRPISTATGRWATRCRSSWSAPPTAGCSSPTPMATARSRTNVRSTTTSSAARRFGWAPAGGGRR